MITVRIPHPQSFCPCYECWAFLGHGPLYASLYILPTFMEQSSSSSMNTECLYVAPSHISRYDTPLTLSVGL
jgi:hypothetical protein